MMELRHMRYFVMLAQQRNYRHAAALLYISQPSLTQQIQQLERELGVTLLQRTKRSVQLTSAGQTFLAHAQHIIGDTEDALAAMREHAQGQGGTVTLGMLNSLPILQMPLLLRRFHDAYPAIKVGIREGLTDELAGWLSSKQVESILICTMDGCTPSILADPKYIAEEILHEDLGILIAPSHALAGQSTITWAELAGVPLIAMNPGSGLRAIIMHHSREVGFTPNIVYESADLGTICTLVAEGLGAALVPLSVAQTRPEPLLWLSFAAPAPQRSIQLVRPRQASSPAATAWLDFFRATTLSTLSPQAL